MKTQAETKSESPARNIDERRAEAVAAQRRRKMRLHDVIDAMPTFAWTALPDGSIDFANRYWVEFTGLSIEESLGSGWEAAVHPEDVKRNREKWLASIETGEPFENEVRYRSANGQFRWFLGRAVAQRNARGKVVKWYGISTDVEDRKCAEEAMRRSEAYLAEAQRLSHTGSFAYNPGSGNAPYPGNGQTLYWSEELFRIFGFEPKQGGGAGPDDAYKIVHPDDRVRVSKECREAFPRKVDFSQKYRLLLHNGTIKHIHVIWHPVLDQVGELVEYVGTVADVTETVLLTQNLQQSEFYLSEGQRLARMGGWSFTAEGVCDYLSQELYNILGFDPAKGIPTTMDYLRLVHPEDRSFAEGTIQRMISYGEGCDVKKRIIRPDGAKRIVHCVGVPVLENGIVKRFVGTLMDITEQELLSHELKQREAYLAEAQRLSHTGSFGWNASTDTHFWSEETYRIFEYEPSTRITMQLILDRVHPEDLPVMQKVVAGASEGNFIDFEYRLVMPSGSVKDVHAVAQAIGGKPDCIEFIGAVMDITERKKAQESLNAAKARFEGILEIAEDAIISTDSGQRIVLFNQGAERMFGYEAQEVLGKPLDILVPQRFAHSHRGHIGAFAKSPEVSRSMAQRREVFGRRKDGSEFPAEASISKLALGNEVVFTVILRDITDRKHAQQALEKTFREVQALKDEFQQVLNTIPGMVWSNLPDGHVDFLNQRWLEFTGLTLEQASGSGWQAAIHPDDMEMVAAYRKRVLASGEAAQMEVRLRRHDGVYRWLLVNGVSLYDKSGKIVKRYGLSTDIEDRKQAEEKLRRSEQQWKDVFENNPTMYFIVDASGTILLVNPFGAEQLGYTVDELVGSPVLNIFYDPDRTTVQEKVAGCLKQLGRPMSWELRKVRKDGSVLWVRETARAVMRDDQPIVLVACEDITDRKHTEEALRRSEALLAEGERISHTGSWVYKPATGELTSSKERFRIFGLDPEKTPPSTQVFSERVHPEDKPRLRMILDSAIREKRDFEFEYRIFTPDGVTKHVHTVAHAITNEAGELVEFFGSTADITERKLTEQALRRSEAYLAEGQKLTQTGSWARHPATGDLLYCSEEIYRIFGFDPQQGMPTNEMINRSMHPDDLKEVLRRIEKGRQQKTDYHTDFRIVLPDKTMKHIQTVAHIEVNETGDIVRWFGTAMDVTERKKAEEALRRSEAFLAEGQRISQTGSWAWKPATGEWVSSKERFRIFGLDPETTKPSFEVFWERIHPEDKPRFKRVFDAAVREKSDFNIGCRIVTPDWVIKHIHTIGHAITSESGELVEFIGSTMDITERKRAEERAQSHNEAVRLALNSFVEELDLNRFLSHVITGLIKQFQATTAELWLAQDSSSTAKLFIICEQGKIIWADEREPIGLPPRATHITRERPDIDRTPRIIELPAHESLLQPAHIESLKHQGIKTLLLVPLVLGEQNLGFFELRFAAATRLTSDDVNLAQALVHHATLALQLSRLAHRTEQMAVTEERNRMAREIHDTLAQAFAGVVLHSEALGTALGVNKSRSEKALLNIQKLARSGLEEARRSVQALRPKALDNRPLTQALEEAVKRFSEDARLSCEFKQLGKALEMSVEVQNELFRVAQEAMTNVRKHAQATSAWISLEFRGRRVILRVRDNGVGFAANNSSKLKQGYGLTTMRERTQRIGGKLEIESPANGGTAISVAVPLAGKWKPSHHRI